MPALCLLRLAGSVLVQAHDEWQVAEKRYLSETTLALLNSCPDSDEQSGATPAAISDYDAGTHFCMAGTQSLDPEELNKSVTFLKSANSRMNAAVAIVHRDLGTTDSG